ncbi:hypothetical protein [Nocardia puris]|uniref:Uncharacterized protein n=1 Tax=Nocardia puris TaxID=208602 RepID=A0A366DQJ0_9NOCA|nr:hypothetical protein [Nocardia puris]RBO92373.1 hypothetical protein DFR74_10315 [Nocardia puris]
MTGPLWRGLGPGTRTTVRDGLTLPTPRWRDGRLVEERTASEVRGFSVLGARRNAFLVSGTEVPTLPATFPNLGNVTVYNGWCPAPRPADLGPVGVRVGGVPESSGARGWSTSRPLR